MAFVNSQTQNKTTPPSSINKCNKAAQRHPDCMESFSNIHKNFNRATPDMLLLFKHAGLLHKLFINQTSQIEWADLHFKQTLNSRQTHFKLINLVVLKLAIISFPTDYRSWITKSFLKFSTSPLTVLKPNTNRFY